MKQFLLYLLMAATLIPMLSRADDLDASDADTPGISPENLAVMARWGCFTPEFKSSIYDFVGIEQAISDAKAEKEKLTAEMPDLQKQVADAEAKATDLKKELEQYDHAAESDFTSLQAVMKDPNAKPQDQLVEVQAYVWAYPSSPHQSEAQQDLQQVQKKIADQIQAEKDAEAAREAARAQLIQRAQAHDLSLAEWRDFLRGMSQDDLLKYLGRPQSAGTDFWVYSGDMTMDAATQQKVGLQVNFNAGRVTSVGEVPH
ncbi:MAG: hypothetical protein LV479_11140 [Methylacidiphilales bacterium]|nr:hypothetical protein [Candidatus Methylacidiphilales bacterium]